MVNAVNEITLVNQAKNGGKESFGELVELHAESVYAIAYGYVFNSADSRDLVQEIFIKAFRSLVDLRDPAQFRSWLFKLANRKCLDWIGKKRLTTAADPQTIDQLPDPRVDKAVNAQDLLAQTESDRKQVESVLLALPDEHRRVLTLRYLHDMNYEEIAEALDIDQATVTNRIVRAKRYVTKHLSHLDSE